VSDLRQHIGYKLASGRFLLLLAALVLWIIGTLAGVAKGTMPEWSVTLINLVMGWYLRAGYDAARKDVTP